MLYIWHQQVLSRTMESKLVSNLRLGNKPYFLSSAATNTLQLCCCGGFELFRPAHIHSDQRRATTNVSYNRLKYRPRQVARYRSSAGSYGLVEGVIVAKFLPRLRIVSYGNNDPAFQQHFLNQPQAQGKTAVQPNHSGNDFCGKRLCLQRTGAWLMPRPLSQASFTWF
jgi:hypothetical protein